MKRLSKILKSDGDNRLLFWCPGCKTSHTITHGNPGATWNWNGDIDKPSFTPSILAKQGHYAYNEPRDKCWCTYNKDHPNDPSPFTCQHCHSFITDGRIQFLSDCTHELAGQTVDLPAWD